jgi:hypothetical protein
MQRSAPRAPAQTGSEQEGHANEIHYLRHSSHCGHRLRAGGAEPVAIEALEKCAAVVKEQNEFRARLVQQVGVTAEP